MVRIDVISDTHGHLSSELRAELAGADYIVHAGDIASLSDYRELCTLASVQACAGNNDWAYSYDERVTKVVVFHIDSLLFRLAHRREDVERGAFQVGIFGHTHVPVLEQFDETHVLMNPGSPTYPRSSTGPTMGRIIIADARIKSARIIRL